MTSPIESAIRRGVTPKDPEYWRILRMSDREAEQLADMAQGHPAPEHTSRDPWPDGVEPPRGFLALEREAHRNGWVTARTYSLGWSIHGVTGAPTAYGPRYALRAMHPATGFRFVAIYRTNPADGRSGLESTFIFGPSLPPFVGCNATELKEYVILQGRVLPSWVDAIRARHAAQTTRARESSKRSGSGRRRESGG